MNGMEISATACMRIYIHARTSHASVGVIIFLYQMGEASFFSSFSGSRLCASFLTSVILSSFLFSLNSSHAFPMRSLRVCFPDKYISIMSSFIPNARGLARDETKERARAICIKCAGKSAWLACRFDFGATCSSCVRIYQREREREEENASCGGFPSSLRRF